MSLESILEWGVVPDVGGRGVPFGRYHGAPRAIDFTGFERGWSAVRRRFVRKAWWYAGVYTEDLVIGFAVCDAGYAGLGFAYIYDLKTGTLIEEGSHKGLAFAQNFQPQLDGKWQLDAGAGRWRVKPEDAAFAVTFQGKRLTLDLKIDHDKQGLTAIAPAGLRPFNQTYKRIGSGVSGHVVSDGVRREISGPWGAIDFTAGYPPRHTAWNWAALAGTTESGQKFGINLVGDFNAGLENALWIDDDLIPLGACEFQYPTDPAQGPWRMMTRDGVVQLEFTPHGVRRETLDRWLVRTHFVQPFGSFSGKITTDGIIQRLRGTGVVEEHDSLW